MRIYNSSLIRKYPLFVLLLPVFFVLHGFTENYDFIRVNDALLLTLLYMAASGILFFLFRLFYKNNMKAGIAAFLLMAFHFFFGSMQDALRAWFPGSILTRYAFILPFSLAVLATIVIWLRRRKKTLLRLASYINLLFLLLIVMDATWLTTRIINTGRQKINALPEGFRNCADCPRPDVYVIIADEYPGNTELKDLFNFDNTAFLDQLKERGFHVVPGSSSNYNFTPYSIASTLDMEYLDLEKTEQSRLGYTYDIIKNNRFLRYLLSQQYRFYNYSYFSFHGQPARTQETFLPTSTRLITGQTFLSRAVKELRFNLVTRLHSERVLRDYVYANRKNNNTLYDLTVKTAGEKSETPKFVLTHLMLPHYPYYFDKEGNEYPFEDLKEPGKYLYDHFIEYLQYGNKRLLSLVDTIMAKSTGPPVIILLSDHGFRHFKQEIDFKYHFSNLVSVYLPSGNYSAFSDSLTNINLLRAVLNTSFGQRLPYRKDTAIVMDKW